MGSVAANGGSGATALSFNPTLMTTLAHLPALLLRAE
jgi:hypothetical protein